MADKIVITSGLSSAFSWSDISGSSREMLKMISKTPEEQTGMFSVSEFSPDSQKIQAYIRK